MNYGLHRIGDRFGHSRLQAEYDIDSGGITLYLNENSTRIALTLDMDEVLGLTTAFKDILGFSDEDLIDDETLEPLHKQEVVDGQ